MLNPSTPTYGVQSYCFRNTPDNADIAKMVLDLGLNTIEVCNVHADFNDIKSWKQVVETYQSHGVSICSIGVQTFTGDESEREWFECAAAAGAKHISAHFRVNSFATAIPKVQSWAREFGIRVGIHCHGGYMFGGSPDVIEHLIELGGPEIGLCIDTAWASQIGPRSGNAVAWAEKFAGKIYGLHYKDFTFERDGSWNDVIVGTGNLDLPAFNKALKAGGFDGMAVIEYEGNPEDPVPSLKACIARMQKLGS